MRLLSANDSESEDDFLLTDSDDFDDILKAEDMEPRRYFWRSNLCRDSSDESENEESKDKEEYPTKAGSKVYEPGPDGTDVGERPPKDFTVA